jgi:hypothetical protein
MLTPEQIKEQLDYFTGTTTYYKHPFGIMFTDGIKFLCDSCSSYWLIDAVASWQFDKKVKAQDFQVYKLFVNKSHSAILNIEDGNYNVIATQEIVTDFPLESIELFFSNDVLYLPSEH